MAVDAELFEQLRQAAVMTVCGDEIETAGYFQSFDIDDSQLVLCQLVQYGLYGDEGEGPRIVQIAFDAFAAAELHFDAQLVQAQAAPAQGFLQDIQRSGTVLADDQRQVPEGGRIHRVAAEGRVGNGGHQYQLVAHEKFVVQRWARCPPFDEADVDASVRHELFYLFGIARGHFHPDFRIAAAERGEHAGQYVLRDGRARADADVAREAARIFCEGIVQAVVNGEDAVGIVEHEASVHGKRDIPFPPVEERDAHLFFEFAYVPGDGRLRDEQFAGRLREAESVGDRFEYFQSEIGYHRLLFVAAGRFLPRMRASAWERSGKRPQQR